MIWRPIKDRLQTELFKRGHCVGCTKSLSTAHRIPHSTKPNIEIVTCDCRRIYLYNKQLNEYRRATEKDL